MSMIKCPECKNEVDDGAYLCEKCGFDLELYKQAYERIYNEKIQRLNESERENVQPQIVYRGEEVQAQSTYKPRCPYCNSDNLTRITSFDKAVNIALYGIFGNKRKYQWHCNNCKTNW